MFTQVWNGLYKTEVNQGEWSAATHSKDLRFSDEGDPRAHYYNLSKITIPDLIEPVEVGKLFDGKEITRISVHELKDGGGVRIYLYLRDGSRRKTFSPS